MITDLIKRLQEGDDFCFKEIYEIYHFKVYIFVNRYAKQPADTEDIVQNVFIHFWKFRHTISPEISLDAVLFKSSRQEIFNWYKAQDGFPSLLDEELREDLDVIHEEWDEEIALKLEHINLLLEQIPERRRRIFTLHKFEQRSYKEIADEMKMTQSAVAKQISKTLQFLKENVAEQHCLLWFAIIVKFVDY